MTARTLVRTLVALAATLGGLAACRGPADPPWVDDIRFNPEFVGLAVGESDTVSAVPLDRGDRALSERADRVGFHVLNPAIVRVSPLGDGRAELTGLQLGETVVEATLGRGTGRVGVSVQPPGLVSLRIEPDPLLMGGSNGIFLSANAVLLDDQGETLDPEGFTFLWAVADTAIARIFAGQTESVVRVRALSSGTTTLSLRVGSLRESIRVEVTGLFR